MAPPAGMFDGGQNFKKSISKKLELPLHFWENSAILFNVR